MSVKCESFSFSLCLWDSEHFSSFDVATIYLPYITTELTKQLVVICMERAHIAIFCFLHIYFRGLNMKHSSGEIIFLFKGARRKDNERKGYSVEIDMVERKKERICNS